MLLQQQLRSLCDQYGLAAIVRVLVDQYGPTQVCADVIEAERKYNADCDAEFRAVGKAFGSCS
jgi:hypothetical protein